MKRKFKQFLIKHGVYNRFEAYLYISTGRNIDVYINTEGAISYIKSAFGWTTATEEGFVFWRELDALWYNFAREYSEVFKYG
jgi:hypothetical protein